MITTPTQDDILTMVDRWARHQLPIMNRSTEAHGDIQFMIGQCLIRMEAIAHASRDTRDPEMAIRLLQILGLTVSSVERHLQAAGAASGEGVLALRAEPTLIELGEVAGHPPRDSHYTYWQYNRPDTPLMFTGSTMEAQFIRIMNEMHRLYSDSVANLRPVCMGDLPITHGIVIQSMELAMVNNDRITNLLHSFAMNAVQFELFAMTTRMYLCDYPVGMQTFLAPDPFNISGPMEMDVTMGLNDERSRAIRLRMPYLMPQDRARMQLAMQQPSLAARLAEAAGLTEEELAAMSDVRAAQHFARQPGLRGALKAFAHLIAAVETSVSYVATILDHLRPIPAPSYVSNARTLTQHERFDTIPQVVELRRSHPTVHRLVAAASA